MDLYEIFGGSNRGARRGGGRGRGRCGGNRSFLDESGGEETNEADGAEREA